MLADYAKRGVEVRPADFSQPRRVGPDLGAAIDAAKRAGVQHLFYTAHPAPEHSIGSKDELIFP